MNKDNYYWQLHKKIFAKRLNELDSEFYNKVISQPYGDAAIYLNKIVEKEVLFELEKLVPKYEDDLSK